MRCQLGRRWRGNACTVVRLSERWCCTSATAPKYWAVGSQAHLFSELQAMDTPRKLAKIAPKSPEDTSNATKKY